jgi:hypothetical protein
MLRKYSCTWTIQVDGESPREAAEAALEIMRDPESTATVFEVNDFPKIFLNSVMVDLGVAEEG